MKTKPKKILLTFILCLTLFLTISQTQIKVASGANIIYVYPGQSIQTAVNNALAGDTIIVEPGTYFEHVIVTKTLLIQGANSANTIVNGTGNGVIFRLDASQVTLANLTIINAGNGNSAISSERTTATNDYHLIKNNVITTSGYGISFGSSSLSTVTNNTFSNNAFYGISLSDANSNNIVNNRITQSLDGIHLAASTGNTMQNNSIIQTSDGIYLDAASSGNTISYNTIQSGEYAGIWSYQVTSANTIHHNTISEGAYGIYLYNTKSASVYYNYFFNNSRGIRIYGPNGGNSVNNNKIANNSYGLEMISSGSNTFTGNWWIKNTYGVWMSSSTGNTFYHNNFVNNALQVYSDALPTANTWSQSGQGNYWSDYTGLDNGAGGRTAGDGIGDTNLPYGGMDNYPLMYTWSQHDIAVKSVTSSATQVIQGTMVNVTVTVRNNDNITQSETFTVTAKYGNSAIGTQQVTGLAQGTARTLTFNWNTASVPSGNYTISAQASTVTDELNTANNGFTDGIVRIKPLGDINGDGTINSIDLTLLMQAYGSTPGKPNWNPNADLNKDNKVDDADLNLLGRNYGKSS